MKKLGRLFTAALATMALSCHNHPGPATFYASPALRKDSSRFRYKLSEVDNTLDPSCMMPLRAGIGDTAHYKNYVLGFCSADCKKEFFSDPEGNLRLARLKK